VVLGFVLGGATGLVLGSLMGWFRRFEYVCDPLVEALRPIPPLAYIPLIILWVGIGEDARILMIGLAAFLTTVVTAYAGVKEVPQVYVDAARTLGASNFQAFLTVALPASSPYAFAGLRVALAASWTTLVAAELLAAQSGLGYLIQNSSTFYETDNVMAGIAVIGILAFLMDRALRLFQRYATRWADTRR
jgi:ABC-type nitrate/sulfonate/bicarbonate transport system permease component